MSNIASFVLCIASFIFCLSLTIKAHRQQTGLAPIQAIISLIPLIGAAINILFILEYLK